MPREKQYVFSARTTEEGLKRLNELKAEKGISWDELVIEAVCAHYGLDRDTMTLPKEPRAGKQSKEPKTTNSKDKAKS
jgi:hypothetical protein